MKHARILRVFAILAAALAGPALFGQTPSPAGADPFANLHFRSIGPAVMSGRVTDVAVYEANPSIYYIATAHSGLWKTTNHGTTFVAQFQDQGLMSIGDVAVSQKTPDLVGIGIREANNRQSTSWGDGVYKSSDGGKTWKHVGLDRSLPGDALVKQYTDLEVAMPRAISEANALLLKATPVSQALKKFDITLNVPAPVT